jgi:hypothetical protein
MGCYSAPAAAKQTAIFDPDIGIDRAAFAE